MAAADFSALEIPDLWQQEAVAVLQAGKDLVLAAPTGAGKTRVFEWWVEAGGAKSGQVVYTVPTRALANEKYLDWAERGWRVGIATGDRAENTSAPVLVATLETQRHRLIEGLGPALLAIDEYQLVAHAARGLHYELAVAAAPPETQLFLLSGSVANPGEACEWLRRIGREAELVRTTERPVPLEEMPVERLPVPPGTAQGFWARLGCGALAAGLCPLLVFAPRRADAERIARALAAGLPPASRLAVEDAWRPVLGGELFGLMRRGVAFHHSGMTHAARAGIVEPLVKFGHLPFVVATTGLAAGINFSVRSVFVADTRFSDGCFERVLAPDELLQMFGRAGRRGLDEIGTVLSIRNGPGLLDAAPKTIRRREQLEWPALLRIIEGRPAPLRYLRQVLGRLFQKTPPDPGFQPATLPSAGRSNPTRGLGPVVTERMDSARHWLPEEAFERVEADAGECLAWHKQNWRQVCRVPDRKFFSGPGRLVRVKDPGQGWHYALEQPLATAGEDGLFVPVAPVRRKLRLAKKERFLRAQIEDAVAPLLIAQDPAAGACALVPRGRQLFLQRDYRGVKIEAWRDRRGRLLADPPRRRREVVPELRMEMENQEWVPAPGSTLRAWRELGLIDAAGRPTRTGSIVARFQAGEGLMLAAALAVPDYPEPAIVVHLANLRGGFRFQQVPAAGSERMAAAARACFGHRTYPGYLLEGLCPGYGENSAEAIELWREGGIAAVQKFAPEARSGDLERARLEWQSLLRHIVETNPPANCPRWPPLVGAAQAELARLPRAGAIPELSGRWRQRQKISGKIQTRSIIGT